MTDNLSFSRKRLLQYGVAALGKTVKRNVLLQIEIIKSSTALSQLIDENKLKIVGGYDDLDTAQV